MGGNFLQRPGFGLQPEAPPRQPPAGLLPYRPNSLGLDVGGMGFQQPMRQQQQQQQQQQQMQIQMQMQQQNLLQQQQMLEQQRRQQEQQMQMQMQMRRQQAQQLQKHTHQQQMQVLLRQRMQQQQLALGQDQEDGSAAGVAKPQLQCYLGEDTGNVVIEMEGTPLVTVSPSGEVTLSTGGNFSRGTLNALNDTLMLIGMGITASGPPSKGAWSVSDGRQSLLFRDGLVLPSKGQLTASRGQLILQGFKGPSKARDPGVLRRLKAQGRAAPGYLA